MATNTSENKVCCTRFKWVPSRNSIVSTQIFQLYRFQLIISRLKIGVTAECLLQNYEFKLNRIATCDLDGINCLCSPLNAVNPTTCRYLQVLTGTGDVCGMLRQLHVDFELTFKYTLCKICIETL